MKKLFILLCFISVSALSQDIVIDGKSSAWDPSNAALFNAHSIPGVGNTGVPEISVPVYTISDKDMTWPIVLSYNAIGIKVNQVSGQVGMGWSISSGGVISRKMQGLPDDQVIQFVKDSQNTIIDTKHLIGWSFGGADYAVDFPEDQLCNSNPECYPYDEGAVSAYLLSNYFSGKNLFYYDSQPDVYYISAGKLNLKFLFDYEGEPVVLGRSDVKISAHYTSESNGVIKNLTKFEVLDTNGDKYIFDVVEKTLNETSKVLYGENMQPLPSTQTITSFTFNSAWYLSKIISQTGTETIFNYETINYSLDNMLPETRGALPMGSNKEEAVSNNGYVEMKNSMEGKVLRSVSTNNLHIVFDNIDRTDIPGHKLIDKISVYWKPVPSGANQYMKSFKFYYTYRTSPGPYNLPAKYYMRPFLTYFEELHDAVTKKPAYEFEYNPVNLPHRLSTKQDFWGFYNNRESVSTLIPQLYVYPSEDEINQYRIYPVPGYSGTSYILAGTDRTINTNVNQAGILTSIRYPEGGLLELEYESNDFFDADIGMSQPAGGLRVKKLRLHDDNGNILEKNYTYRLIEPSNASSGYMIQFPAFARARGYGSNPDSPPGNHGGAPYPVLLEDYYIYFIKAMLPSQSWHAEDYLSDEKIWNVFTERVSFPYNDLEIEGGIVKYIRVTESVTGAGKTVNTFTIPKNFRNNATLVKSTSGPYFFYVDDYNPEGSISWCNEEDIVWGKARKTGHNIFPFPPLSDQEDLSQGKIKKSVQYNEAGLKVKETEYFYETMGGAGGPKNIYGIHHGISGAVCDNYWSGNPLPISYALVRYKANADAVVSKVVIREYAAPLYTAFTTEETNFEYNLNHSQVVEKWLINSDMVIRGERYKYPQDFSDYDLSPSLPGSYPDQSWGVKRMVERNIVAPIESYSYLQRSGENRLVTDARLTTYKVLTNDVCVPDKIYELKPEEPVGDFVAVNFDYDENRRYLEYDGRYELRTAFDLYDQAANLLQYTDRKGYKNSFKYGYRSSFRVAEFFNAANSSGTVGNECAYFGYEHASANSVADNDFFNLNEDNEGTFGYTGRTAWRILSGNDIIKKVIPDNQHQNYVLSAWVNSDPGFTGGYLTMHTYNPDGNEQTIYPAVTGSSVNYPIVPTNGKWAYIESRIDLGKIRELAQLSANEKIGIRFYFTNPDNNNRLNVDEVVFRPLLSDYKTYSYQPGIGISSVASPVAGIQIAQFDNLGRVIATKDKFHNIVKRYQYSYRHRFVD